MGSSYSLSCNMELDDRFLYLTLRYDSTAEVVGCGNSFCLGRGWGIPAWMSQEVSKWLVNGL